MLMINLSRVLLSLVLNKYICMALLLAILQGCVAVQPFPTTARAGDTITMALGSSENINISDTVVTYTPDNNPTGTIDISGNIRSIFKLYPDKRSAAWLQSSATAISYFSGHGASLDVMVLDLPSTLSTGTGVINIQNNATYPLYTDSPVGQDIAVTILEGTGSPNTFEYLEFGTPKAGSLQSLEAIPHLQIKPAYNTDFSAPFFQFAGAELTISGVLNNEATLATAAQLKNALRVIPDDTSNTASNQKQVSWKINSGVITINFISPNGTLAYFETFVSVFFTNSLYGFTAMPTASIKYYDIDGVDITGTGPPVNVTVCTNSTGCI